MSPFRIHIFLINLCVFVLSQIGLASTKTHTTHTTCPQARGFNSYKTGQAPPFASIPAFFNCFDSDTVYAAIEMTSASHLPIDSGHIQSSPGFIMYTDSFSAAATIALTVNGVSQGTASSNFTSPYAAFYLPAGAQCTITYCDPNAIGKGLPYTIYDFSSGQLLTRGRACDSASGCSVITFTIASPTMSWTLDGSTQSIANLSNGSAVLTGLSTVHAGKHWLTYTYSNNNGCNFTDSTQIIINGPSIAFGPINNPTGCGAPNGGITIVGGSETVGKSTYLFQCNNSTYSTQTGYYGLAPGNYTFKAKDAYGCYTADTTIILTNTAVPPIAAPILSSALLLNCKQPEMLLTETPLLPANNYNCLWSGPANGIKGAANHDTVTIYSAGTYTVTVTNAYTCTATATLTVSADTTAPRINAHKASNPVLNCKDTLSLLSVSANLPNNPIPNPCTYNWFSPVTGGFCWANNQSDTISVHEPGTYTVSVSNPANGCSTVDTFIIQKSKIAFSLNTTTSPMNCAGYGGTATVHIKGANAQPQFSWNAGAQRTLTAATDTALKAGGTYTVTVTDLSTSCATSTSVKIHKVPPAIGKLTPTTPTISLGDNLTFQASGGIFYNWYTLTGADTSAIYLGQTQADSTLTINPYSTSTYCVKITDANACQDEVCTLVQVHVPCDEYFLPNAFSPNGDGENDMLFVRVKPNCVASMKLTILDRWGETVFETTDSNTGWDGTYAGQPLNAGVFCYFLKIQYSDGTQVAQSGNLTLLR